MDSHDGEASSDKRERSERMKFEQPERVELLEKKHNGSANTAVAA